MHRNIAERLAGIEEEIKEVRGNLRYYIEHVNEAVYGHVRRELAQKVSSALMKQADQRFERDLVKNCGFKDRSTCKNGFLNRMRQFHEECLPPMEAHNLDTLAQTKLEEIEYAEKNVAPSKICDDCFHLAQGLFEEHWGVMKALCAYEKTEPNGGVSDLDEKSMAAKVLDPLSHPLRLKILKALYSEIASFSRLSELTGAKGGDLLFHLKRLLDAELVVQRGNRGDYLLTDLGRRRLEGLTKIPTE